MSWRELATGYMWIKLSKKLSNNSHISRLPIILLSIVPERTKVLVHYPHPRPSCQTKMVKTVAIYLYRKCFSDHFCNVANGIRFDDNISSTLDIISKHATHLSVLKIKDWYRKDEPYFHFKCVDQELIGSKFRNINLNKSASYDDIPGKLLPWIWISLSSDRCLRMTTT